MFTQNSLGMGTTDEQQQKSRKRLIVAAILAVALVASLTTVSLKRTKNPEIQADYVWQGETYECSPGMYIEDGVGCLYCPVGTMCPGIDEVAPTDCAPGHWQDKKGKTSCKAASVGHYVPNAKGTAELACAAGSYQGQQGQPACEPARIGHCAETTGMHRDTPCPANTHQPLTGQSSCDPCPNGQHQPFVGQAACIASVSVPWATVVPFTDLASLRSALDNHGCPDGLFIKDPNNEYWDMIENADGQPCEITGTSIKLRAYGGISQTIAINTLTIDGSGMTCAGEKKKWDATANSPHDCSAWAHFGKIQLVYSTGSAGRTFQSMIGKRTIMTEAIQAAYASPISLTFADGRVIMMESYQVTTGVTGGNYGYRIARWWRDGSGNQMHIEINGNDECHYCDYSTGGTIQCQVGKTAGQVVNVHWTNPPTTFTCGNDVRVQLTFVPPAPPKNVAKWASSSSQSCNTACSAQNLVPVSTGTPSTMYGGAQYEVCRTNARNFGLRSGSNVNGGNGLDVSCSTPAAAYIHENLPNFDCLCEDPAPAPSPYKWVSTTSTTCVAACANSGTHPDAVSSGVYTHDNTLFYVCSGNIGSANEVGAGWILGAFTDCYVSNIAGTGNLKLATFSCLCERAV